MFRRVQQWAALQNARLEAHLSTNAFSGLLKLFYVSIVLLSFLWGFRTEMDYMQNPDSIRKFIAIARGTGFTLNLNTALVILLPSRVIFTFIRDSPISNLLPLDFSFPVFHMIVGYFVAAAVVFHIPFHFAWIAKSRAWEWGWYAVNMVVITGTLLLLVFMVLIATSLPFVRKRHFRIFHVVHVTCAMLFFPLIVLHGAFRGHAETYKWIAAPLALYVVDVILRRIGMTTRDTKLSEEVSMVYEGGIIEISVPRPFKFRAGQYAELRVLDISREWHPFTIASAPHEDATRFFVKVTGNWTRALKDAILQRENSLETPLRLQIRGPFGAPCQYIGQHPKIVLIAGGVGATPFTSVCKHLHYLSQNYRATLEAAPRNRLKRASTSTRQISDDELCHFVSESCNVDCRRGSQIDPMEEQTRRFLAKLLHVHTRLGLEELETSRSYGGTSDTDADSSYTSLWNIELSTESIMKSMVSEGRNPDSTGEKLNPESHTAAQLKPNCALGGSTCREICVRLMLFLQSNRVNFALLVLLLIRINFVCIGSIWKWEYVRFTMSSEEMKTARWIAAVDASLGLLLAILLPLIAMIESIVTVQRGAYRQSPYRVLEWLMFVPISILFAVLNIMALVANESLTPTVAVLQYGVFVPVLFIDVAIRMYNGARNPVDGSVPSFSKDVGVPDVDFVWATPYDEEDKWLRRELETLQEGTRLRLHRFVTRTEKADIEESTDRAWFNNTGRPNWNGLFREVATSAPSGSTVGVFFCGPPKMQNDVERAMAQAEVNSNLISAYLSSSARVDALSSRLRLPRQSVLALREFGCCVKFVFRHENF